MAMHVDQEVQDPRPGRNEQHGVVLEVRTNPACLMRSLLIRWDDGEVEELEELEFGPLED